MAGIPYIEAKDIFNATSGGLDIIHRLYPQSIGCENNPNKKFKLREDEKTASAHLLLAKDGSTWLLKDFGDGGKARDGIQCYMVEKGTDFTTALRELAAQYNVVPPEVQAQLIRADYSERDAATDEQEGTWLFQVRDHFNDIEIETIVSKNVLKHVKWKARLSDTTVGADGNLDMKTEEKIMAPYNRIVAVFREYHWHPLESYSIVKNRKVKTFSANDQYPMYLIDEGTHKKIYQPRHYDKAKRFMYEPGTKPKDFIHGYAQLDKIWTENKKRIEEEGVDEEMMDAGSEGESLGGVRTGTKKGKKKTSPKLDEVVLCTGGSDAINVALMGDRVLWLNSETAELTQFQYDQIMLRTDRLYNLPDIDATGKKEAHELAMVYLDIYTIDLPEALKERKDARGYPCKDIRDYLNYFKEKDYRKLKQTALPYRFWERKPKYSGRGDDREFVGWTYEFDNVQAYNFLLKNGFGRLSTGNKKTDWIYVRRDGNIVSEQNPNDIKNFIHNFLRERLYDKDLRNKMYRDPGLNEASLSNLDLIDIDFTDNTAESQFLFFRNKTVEITKDDIRFHKAGAVNKFIWQEDLLQHHIEEAKTAPFIITKNEYDEYDIEVVEKNCPFLNYLVQTSRIHWRKEMEENLDGLFAPPDIEKYKADNHCTIAGANLSAEEISEQKRNLVSKIQTIGFLLHRYKAPNKGWFVWAMDSKIPDDGASHGGSGKSILFDKAMRRMMPKNFFMNGRNPKLTDDPHKYDGMTEHIRYILVDDAHEYLNLDVFYPDITADMNVNPKGKQPFAIPFERSPKMTFTSNYSPRKLGPSTERRMLYAIFSDWYHNKGETDDYREMRDPKSDLGLTLFTDFNRDQWNSFYNLMMYCLKFYLGTEEKIKPAMDNVNKRNMLAMMGNLHEWALVYFSAESGRLDKDVIRQEAFTDYRAYAGNSKITPQAFLGKLKAFCKYYGYVLNPAEFQNKQGTIIKKVEQRMYNKDSNSWIPMPGAPQIAKEILYIQSRNELKAEEPAAYIQPLPVQTTMSLEDNIPGEPEERDDEPF